MRVVAGTASGRRLRGPITSSVRPTTDRVREAVFNALESMNVIAGATVLDLYAGTGACGIEALSRGAESVTFVDNDRRSLQVVRENLTNVGFNDAQVVQCDALAYLDRHLLDRQLLDHQLSFDLVFADPPYLFDDWKSILERVESSILVCESNNAIISNDRDRWECIRERRYGDTMVTIFRRIKF